MGPGDVAGRIWGARAVVAGSERQSAGVKRVTRDDGAKSTNPASRLRGRMMFHRYTNYDAWDVRLYLYNFGTKRLRCLSERWEIDHAINGNFSPDGTKIVFMGVPRGQHRGDAWDDQEYFPVALDASSFLHVRWASQTDHHDQIWVSSFDGRTRKPLRFNQPASNSSDPFPIDDRYVIYSSTRTRAGRV